MSLGWIEMSLGWIEMSLGWIEKIRVISCFFKSYFLKFFRAPLTPRAPRFFRAPLALALTIFFPSAARPRARNFRSAARERRS